MYRKRSGVTRALCKHGVPKAFWNKCHQGQDTVLWLYQESGATPTLQDDSAKSAAGPSTALPLPFTYTGHQVLCHQPSSYLHLLRATRLQAGPESSYHFFFFSLIRRKTA